MPELSRERLERYLTTLFHAPVTVTALIPLRESKASGAAKAVRVRPPGEGGIHRRRDHEEPPSSKRRAPAPSVTSIWRIAPG